MFINIIRSFYEDMKARVLIGNELLEEIRVQNGLRQGCTMAPVLFNLYTCLISERRIQRVAALGGIGVELLYKFDQRLFRRSTRNGNKSHLTDCQFADDVVIMAPTRAGAEMALQAYMDTASAFGMTVSLQKTKLMVVGHAVTDEEKAPILIGDQYIECLDDFTYMGSTITSNGRMDADIDRRTACASRAFGALRKAVFRDRNLTLTTKRQVYQACVLSVLLYSSECWTPQQRHIKRLNSFHHRCIRSVLGITNKQQWELHITSAMTRPQWGDPDTVSTKVQKRRLEWLGHLARMPDYRLPKKVLFGWLPQPRPAGDQGRDGKMR